MFRLLTNYRITDRALCTFQFFLGYFQISYTSPVVVSIYPGVLTGVCVVRGILGLRNAYLKWSQTVRDKEFLVEMRLRNLEPEETKEKAAEKKEGQEQEEAAVGDLPVLDLIGNQCQE
ncbi:hypothetical protein BDM02DRAFT_3121841 [Thelephora ganbajun]|uniref:Uncharacterized protein n=1 Tax=Thelephora ganbajun TaxID=370292 RepID=A0ACB6Z4H0_THEGA|nr:hypothetical protein BDM02DRAFT_3121841 [Thelephora ganbajun]